MNDPPSKKEKSHLHTTKIHNGIYAAKSRFCILFLVCETEILNYRVQLKRKIKAKYVCRKIFPPTKKNCSLSIYIYIYTYIYIFLAWPKKKNGFLKKPQPETTICSENRPFEKGRFLWETMIFHGALIVLSGVQWPLGFPTVAALERWTWPPAVAARQRRPGCPMTTCWVLMGWTRWCGKLWQRPVKR